VKTDLVEVVDSISDIDGRVSITDLSEAEIVALNDKILWTYSDHRDPLYICRFGNDRFRAKGQRDSISTATGRTKFDFELKAVLVLLLRVGVKEGGRPFKWNTVGARIDILRHFAGFCAARGLHSFRDLNRLSGLRLRNLLFGYFLDGRDKGGLSLNENTGSYHSVRGALKHLKHYGFVSMPEFIELLDELTLPGVSHHNENHRLRHGIIPTRIMKSIINEAASYLELAEKHYGQFAKTFQSLSQHITKRRARNWRESIRKHNPASCCQLQPLFKYFVDLQLHTYALVLAFTGMRDNEVAALQTGCGGYKVEDGEYHYFIKSLLSKTDDDVICLDWVANELAYRAVALLSKVNDLYYERAHLIKKYYGPSLTICEVNAFDHGLADRLLFGVRFSKMSVSFIRYPHSSSSNSFLKLSRYAFAVSSTDIAQLEQMECNYRSVSGMSKDRGKPYQLGDFFKPTAHQFRHTFAWFIVANRLGDIDDIKYQYKHLHQAMTLIYTERGFQSLDELRAVIEEFETIVNKLSIKDIVESAATNSIAGGGGERLAKILQNLNADIGADIFRSDQQPLFKDMLEVISFTTRHSDSIRGLPHGYCTKGPSCKIKNAADPSHCLYCDTYFATPKHLQYWQAIKNNCEAKLSRIEQMPEDRQQQYGAFRQSLEDNLFAADNIIRRLLPAGAYDKGGSL